MQQANHPLAQRSAGELGQAVVGLDRGHVRAEPVTKSVAVVQVGTTSKSMSVTAGPAEAMRPPPRLGAESRVALGGAAFSRILPGYAASRHGPTMVSRP